MNNDKCILRHSTEQCIHIGGFCYCLSKPVISVVLELNLLTDHILKNQDCDLRSKKTDHCHLSSQKTEDCHLRSTKTSRTCPCNHFGNRHGLIHELISCVVILHADRKFTTPFTSTTTRMSSHRV